MTLYFVKKYVDVLTKDLTIDSHDKELLIRFYKSTLIGITLDWLDENMNYDIADAFFSYL